MHWVIFLPNLCSALQAIFIGAIFFGIERFVSDTEGSEDEHLNVEDDKEDEDDEDKAPTSKKSHSANFSILSLLGRRSGEEEEVELSKESDTPGPAEPGTQVNQNTGSRLFFSVFFEPF